MAYNAENPIYLNQNPLNIIDEKWYAWYKFYRYITDNTNLKNQYKTNTNVGKDISTKYIDEYNSINAINANYQISSNSIIEVQKFNKITDSDVEVDGWLGTQTAKLVYPNLNVFILTNENLKRLNQPKLTKPELQNNEPIYKVSDIYAPVFWGNKRYLLDYKTIHDAWQTNKGLDWKNAIVPYSKLKYYDSNKNLINSNNIDTFNLHLTSYDKSLYFRYNPLTLLYEQNSFNWEDPYYQNLQPTKPTNFVTSSTVKIKESKDPTTEKEQKTNGTLKSQTTLTEGISNPK